ncbi:MAG: lipid-A-disaccharide synthase [Mariprofundales bacterium]|nr:lipid-A-disaccharide synthase [Mariprofundales bacterium]
MSALSIFISAGESSGDMHAAEVVRALYRQPIDVDVVGIAGPAMCAAGCVAWFDQAELAVMGIGDVLRHLPRILSLERDLLARVKRSPPAVAVLVDFSSFHLRLGRKLRQMGVPVLHYIAPKLWAWGGWRVRRLRQSQDLLVSILPFEIEWFAARGVTACYLGNPVAYRARAGWSREQLCAHLGLNPADRVLAVLPGSRAAELARHLPLLTEVVQRLRAEDAQLQVVVPRAPSLSDSSIAPLIAAGCRVVDRLHPDFALRVDAAVAVSGTATLELALWQTPTVLIYRGSPLMIWLARRLVRLNCAGLANILLGDREVMPELIQEQATLEATVEALRPLLAGGDEAVQQIEQFSRLLKIMGSSNPADGVAERALSLI